MSFSAAQLQRVMDEAPAEISVGDCISRGFKFMNENVGLLIAFTLLTGVVSAIAQNLPYVGFIISIVLGPVLNIGYAQFMYAAKRERRVDFGEFFKGFSKFGPLLATYLLTGVAALLACLPGILVWYQAGMADWIKEMVDAYPNFQDIPNLFEMVDSGHFFLGLALVILGALVVGILFAWALNIVWFYDVGPWEALQASRKLIARQWGTILGLFIVCGLIAGAGVLLCIVGVLYTAPAMVCAQVFAFADVTKLFEVGENNQDDLIDHFIA